VSCTDITVIENTPHAHREGYVLDQKPLAISEIGGRPNKGFLDKPSSRVRQSHQQSQHHGRRHSTLPLCRKKKLTQGRKRTPHNPGLRFEAGYYEYEYSHRSLSLCLSTVPVSRVALLHDSRRLSEADPFPPGFVAVIMGEFRRIKKVCPCRLVGIDRGYDPR
jgi:hypothetical protein